jgi:SAM-dependent methyltransferase
MAGSTVHQEHLQRVHYDTIATSYELHYSDTYSTQYRRLFFHAPMTHGIDVRGLRVLDAMSGSGQTAEYLSSLGADVVGLDISPAVIDLFKEKLPQCEAIQRSILDTGLPECSFDCVFVLGGLHHLHPCLPEAMDEIHRILRPGGYLCFAEPHTGSLPDLVRAWWYKRDPLFEENEAAIDLEELKIQNRGRFEFCTSDYLGNVAYLFVFNSMIFRVSPRFKALYAPMLLRLESILNRVCTKRFSCFVVCQWRKMPASQGVGDL